jgi:hypothetical protein
VNPTLVVLLYAIVFLSLPTFSLIYTPQRSQWYRYAKWALLLALMAVQLRSKMAWMIPVVGWSFYWSELQRHAIRRKLPVGQWPKHLYL